MSRTTTEDCKEECPNHFNLAFHAAHRAHQILRRGDAQVPENDDRVVVLALREIAAGLYKAPSMKIESAPQNESVPQSEAAEAAPQSETE